MCDTLCRGNKEMTSYILGKGGQKIRSMWERRDANPVVRFRVCSPREAINTWFYCLAGGQFRELTSDTPSDGAKVNQVGNSEGIHRTGQDPRLAMLMSLQGVKVQLAPPKREVVEYLAGPGDAIRQQRFDRHQGAVQQRVQRRRVRSAIRGRRRNHSPDRHPAVAGGNHAGAAPTGISRQAGFPRVGPKSPHRSPGFFPGGGAGCGGGAAGCGGGAGRAGGAAARGGGAAGRGGGAA